MTGLVVAGASPASASITGCLAAPIVGEAAAPSGNGYWLVGADGGVFAFGPDAHFWGSAATLHLNKPIVAIVPTADGGGYWLVAADGGVFAYGNATSPANNTLPGTHLNAPIVGAARAGNTNGLWLTAADGGVFAFNGAPFKGSAATLHLNKPVVGIVSNPAGDGYWLVAADGGVFAYNAPSPAGNPLPGMKLNAPIVGAARYGNTNGLWLTAADGGVFALPSTTPFYGSMAGKSLAKPVVGIASTPSGDGYWLAAADGGVFAYNKAGFFGNAVSTATNCNPVTPPSGNKIVQAATDIMNGKAEPGWGGGSVPYSWGGGHSTTPGPSLGTCVGYTGSTKPCPASSTKGADCSGFARWVYSVAYGRDALGAGNTDTQAGKMTKVSSPQAGDLVFYGYVSHGHPVTHHVGVFVGNGKMIDALKTGTHVETDNVSIMPDVVGYYRLVA